MCSCLLKGIYVTRVSPGGPADEAGLKEGDKIMQVCREKSPQGGVSSVRLPLALVPVRKWLQHLSNPTFPLFPRWTAGTWPWWPTTRPVKSSPRRMRTWCDYWSPEGRWRKLSNSRWANGRNNNKIIIAQWEDFSVPWTLHKRRRWWPSVWSM